MRPPALCAATHEDCDRRDNWLRRLSIARCRRLRFRSPRVTSRSDILRSPQPRAGVVFSSLSFLLLPGHRISFSSKTHERSIGTRMTKNKNKKPHPSPNQERNSGRNEGPGRGGSGRGRGGRGGHGGVDDGGGEDDFSRRRGGIRGGGPPGSNPRGGPPPSVLDRGFGRGRGRGRGGWVGRGRGFGGVESGSFMGNFRGGRPAYHSMGEIDFEIQQRSESTKFLIIRTHACSFHIHLGYFSQTNRRKTGGTLPVAGDEGHPRNPMETTRLEVAEVAVVVEATPRNFHLPRHCQVSGTKNDRCYGLSSLLGLSSPPRYFKRPRNSSNRPLKIQASVSCPESSVSAENSKLPPSR